MERKLPDEQGGDGIRGKNKEFILLAGSKVYLTPPSSTCPEHVKRLRVEYENKIVEGRLTENIIFSSSSTAASFLAHANRSGNVVWKTAEGVCLGEYRKKF